MIEQTRQAQLAHTTSRQTMAVLAQTSTIDQVPKIHGRQRWLKIQEQVSQSMILAPNRNHKLAYHSLFWLKLIKLRDVFFTTTKRVRSTLKIKTYSSQYYSRNNKHRKLWSQEQKHLKANTEKADYKLLNFKWIGQPQIGFPTLN